MIETIYKIRRRCDGLYSTGGESPDFTTKGKAWGSMGALRNHLALFIRSDGTIGNYSNDFPYVRCVIDEYKFQKTFVGGGSEPETPLQYCQRRAIEKKEEAINYQKSRFPRWEKEQNEKIERMLQELADQKAKYDV